MQKNAKKSNSCFHLIIHCSVTFSQQFQRFVLINFIFIYGVIRPRLGLILFLISMHSKIFCSFFACFFINKSIKLNMNSNSIILSYSNDNPYSGLSLFKYRTRAIITRGLYIFYPLLGSLKRFFKEVFS